VIMAMRIIEDMKTPSTNETNPIPRDCRTAFMSFRGLGHQIARLIGPDKSPRHLHEVSERACLSSRFQCAGSSDNEVSPKYLPTEMTAAIPTIQSAGA